MSLQSLDEHPRLRRCRATLRHEPVDRVPFYSPAVSCAVASEILGRKAFAGTGSLHFAEVSAWADGENAHADFEARLEEDLVALNRALDIDVLRMPWRMNMKPDARLDEHTFRFGPEDGRHSIWQYQPATADFGPIHTAAGPLAPEDVLRAEIRKMEQQAGDPRPALLRKAAPVLDLWRKYGREFFVCGVSAGIGIGLQPEIFEMMATEPDLIRGKLLLQADQAIGLGEILLAEGCPPVLLGGGDLAGSHGPLYSPAMFRRLVLPAYVKALSALNKMGAHYVFRSDGNIWPLTGMLFEEAGCPGYGEADRDASMTVAGVRARFPSLVIWGNVSSSLLAHGTAEKVREEVRRVLAESMERGYFQGCSNAIVQGTPVSNVLALFAQ